MRLDAVLEAGDLLPGRCLHRLADDPLVRHCLRDEQQLRGCRPLGAPVVHWNNLCICECVMEPTSRKKVGIKRMGSRVRQRPVGDKWGIPTTREATHSDPFV
ncbi:hypothetical protein Aduo_008910 [Ancylostoma duodenale]